MNRDRTIEVKSLLNLDLDLNVDLVLHDRSRVDVDLVSTAAFVQHHIKTFGAK